MYRKPCTLLLLFAFLACQTGPATQTDTAENMSLRIAIAQIFCLDGDRSGNFRRIENALIRAKTEGADIVCFPEMAILGWVNPDAHERAFPIPGSDTERLGELARQYGVFIAIGLGEKDGDQLYDSAVLIDDQGEILLKHRKNNILSELMDPPYTPGSGVQVVDTKFGRIGMMICADTFLEELVAEMAELAPDLLLIPYGWAEHEDRWPKHANELEAVVVNTGKKVKTTVVGTDLVGEISKGPWAGYVYGGQSLAVDATGKVLVKLADRDSDLQILKISR
ncbi:carbon-nitrogen hydrolase family protein [Flavilitoribacter nigricans]|uniref:Beta-alanine synthetase n=1 Tax=Flavilitoribacter nigricans (strain ATCC 23147 / DSM 23189 / NBRC 102662 / NCIMB 1420 / SS-2) TaxID=1122177 RepID=A0A2D0NCZ3_FLAN2|nr:carbon-nitrogen hydrolase family protein [Flavilitoribacter nigricans]PHN06049.1 beta-alanine synthetase [Flavilitoribacter nigricans DSM 23189 = NBRC 102662]